MEKHSLTESDFLLVIRIVLFSVTNFAFTWLE